MPSTLFGVFWFMEIKQEADWRWRILWFNGKNGWGYAWARRGTFVKSFSFRDYRINRIRCVVFDYRNIFSSIIPLRIENSDG